MLMAILLTDIRILFTNYDNIHLFPLHKGDMKICSPEKSHISRGKRRREISCGTVALYGPQLEGNMTISRVNKFSHLPYAREMNVLFHQATVLVNYAK